MEDFSLIITKHLSVSADSLGKHNGANVIENEHQQSHQQNDLEGLVESLHDEVQLLKHPEQADDPENTQEPEDAEHPHDGEAVENPARTAHGDQWQDPQVQCSAANEKEVENVPRFLEVAVAKEPDSQAHLQEEDCIEKVLKRREGAGANVCLQADDYGIRHDHHSDHDVEIVALHIEPNLEPLLQCVALALIIRHELAILIFFVLRLVILARVGPSAQ
mmetsp:Transcript_137103/g.356201  ORF Transcript_137103/g.356201 Transcript_137103/m.356201 type:complete len:219 (-) Transcript_137103:110-766(-)